MQRALISALALSAIPAWALSIPPTPPPTSTQTPAQRPPTVDGGWFKTTLSPDLSTFLYSSLANLTLYAPDINDRVCIKSISQVEGQLVGDMNYRFSTTACDIRATLREQSNKQQTGSGAIAKYLGQCPSAFARNCVLADATVVVYKKWDSSVKVSSIDVKIWPRSPGGVHAN